MNQGVQGKRINIIGGSVAGLGTALEVLKLNPEADVVVYEKKSWPYHKIVCGGAISSIMVKKLGLEIPDLFIASKLKSVRIYSPNMSFWEIKGDCGLVLFRDYWECRLAEMVRFLGGEIVLKHEVTDKQLFEMDVNEDVVIGADGVNGVTRRFLQLPQPIEDLHLGVQRVCYLPSHPHDRIDLYFGNKIAPKGYAWVFPGHKDFVRIGLGVPLSLGSQAKKLLDNFIKLKKAMPWFSMDAKLIPTAKPEKRLVHHSFALVGDAGLLCDPLTGGGIAQALESGKMVAQAIHEGSLGRYESYCRSLKRRNLFRYKLKRFLFGFSDEDYNELIEVAQEFNPDLSKMSWSLMKAIFKLAITKPGLAVKHKMLRTLLK